MTSGSPIHARWSIHYAIGARSAARRRSARKIFDGHCLGHEERTVAAGYGEGFSLPVLRKWIDKIGF